MSRLRKILQVLQQIFHILGIIASPMVAILLIVGVTTLFEAIGKHTRFVGGLDADGKVSNAVLYNTSTYGNHSWIAKASSASGEDLWIYLKTEYYSPDVVAGFEKGQTVTVRYDATLNGVLEEYYPTLRGYLGHLRDPALIILISWIIIILHPEFLYINMPGFSEAVGKTWKRSYGDDK